MDVMSALRSERLGRVGPRVEPPWPHCAITHDVTPDAGRLMGVSR